MQRVEFTSTATYAGRNDGVYMSKKEKRKGGVYHFHDIPLRDVQMVHRWWQVNGDRVRLCASKLGSVRERNPRFCFASPHAWIYYTLLPFRVSNPNHPFSPLLFKTHPSHCFCYPINTIIISFIQHHNTTQHTALFLFLQEGSLVSV